MAVSAMMGKLFPRASMMVLILLYSGRKSCPHSEIQCASSIAINEILDFKRKFIVHQKESTMKKLIILLTAVIFIVVGKAQSDDHSVGADLIVFNAKITTESLSQNPLAHTGRPSRRSKKRKRRCDGYRHRLTSWRASTGA